MKLVDASNGANDEANYGTNAANNEAYVTLHATNYTHIM